MHIFLKSRTYRYTISLSVLVSVKAKIIVVHYCLNNRCATFWWFLSCRSSRASWHAFSNPLFSIRWVGFSTSEQNNMLHLFAYVSKFVEKIVSFTNIAGRVCMLFIELFLSHLGHAFYRCPQKVYPSYKALGYLFLPSRVLVSCVLRYLHIVHCLYSRSTTFFTFFLSSLVLTFLLQAIRLYLFCTYSSA